MSEKINNNTCRKCGAVDSYKEKKGMLGGTTIQCNISGCSDVMSPEQFEKHKSIANPRCPNIECDYHKNPPPAKLAFIISVVEEGFLGKIFKSEAYGIVSCKNCGHTIGVGGKG
jgi:hypothetical protein